MNNVGQTVHYVRNSSGGAQFPKVCRAAVITEVGDGIPVGLVTFEPTGQRFYPLASGGVDHSLDVKDGGTWHHLDECADRFDA